MRMRAGSRSGRERSGIRPGAGLGPLGAPPQTPGHGAFPRSGGSWASGSAEAAVCCSDPQLRVGEIKLRKDKHYFKSDLKD